MTLFTNDNILFILGSVFVVITIVSLIELSYVVCVLERRLQATEHLLQRDLHQYMMRQDTLIRQLKDTRIEMLSNHCDQLAKTRLMRREFRVLLRKCLNTTEQDPSA